MRITVSVQRYVEQVATIEVEADSVEDAVEAAEDMVRSDDPAIAWTEGGDTVDGAAAEVGGPRAPVAQVEVRAGRITEGRVARVLVAARAGDDHPHDVVIEWIVGPVHTVVGDESAK